MANDHEQRIAELERELAASRVRERDAQSEVTALRQGLAEALEIQSVTSEILQAISRCPTDDQPVLDAIARSARRLCSADQAWLNLLDGDEVVNVAAAGVADDWRPSRGRLDPENDFAYVVREQQIVQFCGHDDPHFDRFPEMREEAARAGVIAGAILPLLQGDQAIGYLPVTRREARPFTDREIELLKTFADEAVIVIVNARLFDALRQRTEELSRTVEQLRALSEVGQVVTSSLDLETVLRTIVARAVELTGTDGGVIYEYDDAEQVFRLRADTQDPHLRGTVRVLREHPLRLGEGTMGRAGVLREPVQVPDIAPDDADAGPVYSGPIPERLRQQMLAEGIRSVVAVPLIHQGQLVGGLTLARRSPGAFPAELIELVRTFATQSAIAIQNARLYQAIEAQRRELEEVSRHKSEFLASMSHELRTPLNAIIGFSEVLLDPTMPVDDTFRQQFLDNILASGKHLLGLINDILDLSKVEAGKLELHPETFDLAETLRGVHAVIRAAADKKQQQLRLELAPDLGTAEHDPSRFKQVLFNLLSNAVKFTPEGGTITTSARVADGGWLEIAVSDTGIGIAPEDHARVFEEFRQIDSGYARKQQGTGLGLALVRNFVQLMGGEITLRSALGAGSTFTFRLPRRHGDLAAGAGGDGPMVLVVEDDAAAAELLQFHLRRGGYTVDRAATAEEALAKTRAAPPAAITLDLRLPDEPSGWTLLRRLKSDPATAPIPLVVVSILEDEGLARQAGAAAHLVKPVDARVLLATLDGVTRRAAVTDRG